MRLESVCYQTSESCCPLRSGYRVRKDWYDAINTSIELILCLTIATSYMSLHVTEVSNAYTLRHSKAGNQHPLCRGTDGALVRSGGSGQCTGPVGSSTPAEAQAYDMIPAGPATRVMPGRDCGRRRRHHRVVALPRRLDVTRTRDRRSGSDSTTPESRKRPRTGCVSTSPGGGTAACGGHGTVCGTRFVRRGEANRTRRPESNRH